MTRRRYAVVGGGILGVAVAHRLLELHPEATVSVLEKEHALARHQTGHNSGVVHAGLYYAPGSLKARLCRQGVGLLKDFCTERELPYRQIGKVLVARDDAESVRLDGIADRAHANGVPGVRRLDAAGLRELEPHVRGVAALHSPTTAIVDYPAITRRLAALVIEAGGQVRTATEVVGLHETATGVLVRTRAGGADPRCDDGWLDGAPADDGPAGVDGEEFDVVVLCAGLHVDRLARRAGADAAPRIVPFRGEYLALRPGRRDLVNGLVYPVPDPRYPFLGVHLTPRVDGEVLIGPNAVLALAREGYGWRTVVPREVLETLTWPGFAPFARQHWRTGLTETVGSLSRSRFVAAARRYVPELTTADVVPGPRGVRAQAMDRDGSLVDDFRIDRRGRVVALRNAPSPAATSSLAIARHLVDALEE
ncbi:L-2-hydroxyglutarate oxidase [Georgenia sp. 10Sc9-8]|uniref:L-2-hydroxyglutarate oxidase n=1 Tax=Georgenia halotolerans TaxID=3028317 RepID=A0ABT5TWE0_9MICO|nr:L-2-hydroxyglutarate oxidase [Georgenia halotolerans]